MEKKLVDSLWNSYWVNARSLSSAITDVEYLTWQVFDLSDKLENSKMILGRAGLLRLDSQEKKTEDKLSWVTHDSYKTIMEALHSLMAKVGKNRLLN